MTRFAFILGAGAHAPFGFPTGRTFRQEIVKQLREIETPGDADTFKQARRAVLDCGVSIDRFLSESQNAGLNEFIRPAIARCLLSFENDVVSQDQGMTDWLEYLWQSLSRDGGKKLSNRFSFVTFNYDRTLEYRLARAFSALYAVPFQTAASAVEELGIYHVYGSLGTLTAGAERIEYGDVSRYRQAGQRIKIIGEQDAKTTDEIHCILQDAEIIVMLGCAFHPENMELLALDKLPDMRPKMRRIQASCFSLSAAECNHMVKRYSYLSLGAVEHDCLMFLRTNPLYQLVR
jgi:hypothetical protein